MKTSRKLILSVVLALMLGVIVANAALAFDCNNPNINDNALVGTFNAGTGVFTPNKANWGSFDSGFNGAWVKIIFPWGDSYNIFVKSLLPDGARSSGPGEDQCDGKGIDDLDACLVKYPPPAP